MSTQLLSPQEAKASLRKRGVTIREWARQNGLSERIVHEVLRGRFKGKYGQAHRAAVLLGIKDGVIE